MKVKSISKNIEYVPLCDKNDISKNQTVFELRHPTLAEKIQQESQNTIELFGDISRIIKDPRSFEYMVELVRACIVDIKNLSTEDGESLLWKEDQKEGILNHIYGIIPELYNVLMQKSELDEEQEKN